MPDAAGGPNLLVAQWPNGFDDLAIVGSQNLALMGRGFAGVPPGHSFIGGWTAQNRTAIVCDDLDADGQREVITAINGVWNRVTVYSEKGKPLANAQFGPGADSTPGAHMRAFDVADLDGDGKKELVAGISEGLIVVLDHQCRKRWSVALPSPPVSLRCLRPPESALPWIIVGCENGDVAALDGNGEILRKGKVVGRPMHLEALATSAGLQAVFATDQGQVRAFRLGR
jgi:hypothetical protein